jgi:hypothetical protein
MVGRVADPLWSFVDLGDVTDFIALRDIFVDLVVVG